MVDHLDQITCNQSKSKQWFWYKTGRITTVWFKQVLHTDSHQPSLSLLNSICYPEIHKFSTQSTYWGCEHEKDVLLAYKTQISPLHKGYKISRCGFFVSVEHLFLGASPDALIQCMCYGEGVVEIKCPLCTLSLPFKSSWVGYPLATGTSASSVVILWLSFSRADRTIAVRSVWIAADIVSSG